MPVKVLIIGLDGLDPDIAKILMESGDLPNLLEVSRLGFFSKLKSTVPPFTYPAWSSFLTGSNPGIHGICDFVIRKQNSYSLEFVNSSHRLVPNLFEILSWQGCSVGAMGIPTTYPPSPVNGFMISGFDSPVAVNADPSFCHPKSLYQELNNYGCKYTLAGIQEIRKHRGWHENAVRTMFHTIEMRTKVSEYLIGKDCYDVAMFTFSESDTAGHHFWSFYDENAPRRLDRVSAWKDVLKDIYIKLDITVGRLIDIAGPETNVFIISDHGMGGTSNYSFSINRLLESSGIFKFADQSKKKFPFIESRKLVSCIPVKCQEMLFRKHAAKLPAWFEKNNRLSVADLENCYAFSDELNYFPSIWIHDNRFPLGRHLKESERERLLEDISSVFLEYRNPFSQKPVIKNVFRKEEIYSGGGMERFPDIILELDTVNNYAYAIKRESKPGSPVQEIPPDEWIGAKGMSMNGSHRSHGIFYACGPLIKTSSYPETPELCDLAPTIFGLLQRQIPSFMDGRYMNEILRFSSNEPLKQNSGINQLPVHSDENNPKEYSQSENKELMNRLNDLGYF